VPAFNGETVALNRREKIYFLTFTVWGKVGIKVCFGDT